MKLTIKQTIALDTLEDNKIKELIFGGGAGGAKSVLGCYWQIKNRLKYPGTRGLIGRAVLKTLKDTTLNSFFWVAAQQGLKSGYHYIYNAQRGIISFPSTESEILLKDLQTYPSDPNFDELGSLEITDAFVDEVNQVSKKAWNITKSRLRYRIDEYGLIPKILGTCNPSKNWVYSDFYKPFKEGKLEDNKMFIQALLSDNPHISKHYRDNLLTLDKNSRERLLHGNWSYDDDPAALMTIDAINNLWTNTFVRPGKRYITADVARFGKDKSVIMVWEGLRLIKVVVLTKKSVTWVAQEIAKLRNEYMIQLDHVIVDEDGVGGGVVDILGCTGFVNNSRPKYSENFEHLKSQCYYKLAETVNGALMYLGALTESEMIADTIEELEQVKQKDMDKDGKKKIIPKDEVKEHLGRSPDYSDAIMMRMYFEIEQELELESEAV